MIRFLKVVWLCEGLAKEQKEGSAALVEEAAAKQRRYKFCYNPVDSQDALCVLWALCGELWSGRFDNFCGFSKVVKFIGFLLHSETRRRSGKFC